MNSTKFLAIGLVMTTLATAARPNDKPSLNEDETAIVDLILRARTLESRSHSLPSQTHLQKLFHGATCRNIADLTIRQLESGTKVCSAKLGRRSTYDMTLSAWVRTERDWLYIDGYQMELKFRGAKASLESIYQHLPDSRRTFADDALPPYRAQCGSHESTPQAKDGSVLSYVLKSQEANGKCNGLVDSVGIYISSNPTSNQ